MKSVRRPRLSVGAFRWLGLLLSLAAVLVLAFVLARGDWRTIGELIAGARFELLAAALAAVLAVEVTKTVRWQVLLGIAPAQFPELLALIFSARLLNSLAPLRAGDVWRITFVSRAQQRHLVATGGSVLAEKVLDGAGLAVLSLLAIGSLGSETAWLALLGVGLLAAGGLALVARRSAWAARLATEMRRLRDGRALLAGVVLTAIGLLLGLAANLLVLRALGLPASPTLGVVMLIAGYAAGALPAVPGQLGVYELAVSAPLVAAGLPPPAAVAAALALHLVLLAGLLVGGLVAAAVGSLRPVRPPCGVHEGAGELKARSLGSAPLRRPLPQGEAKTPSPRGRGSG